MKHRARKRFGQNFLVDKGALLRIAAMSRGADKVLEIGPGLGALTRAMREQGTEVRAVELDRDLAEHIRMTLPTVDLVEGDALKLSLEEMAPGEGWVVCANLPYNVGTQILLRMLPEHPRFSRLVLMFQKEVAKRITAVPGTKAYGSLSVLVRAHAKARIVLELPPTAFDPAPKVESAVVELILHPPKLDGVPTPHFEKVVRAGFSLRRKTLENALSRTFSKDRARAATAVANVAGKRAEQLDLARWVALAKALQT
jgi:16S rRNA (adenine1518-N6/adenine1519-N6)-dimethyltransferase